MKRGLSPLGLVCLFIYFFYPLPNHFLSPSSRRPPPHISPFALLAHTIIYSFIPLCCVVFLLGTLIFLFSPDLREKGDKKENKGPRWHRRRGHAHDVVEEQRLCATSLAVVVINLWMCAFLSPATGLRWCGCLVDRPNLPTGTSCKCRSSSLGTCNHGAMGVEAGCVCMCRGMRTHDRGEGSSEECEQVTVAGQSR